MHATRWSLLCCARLFVVVSGALAGIVVSAQSATVIPPAPAQRMCVLCDFGMKVSDPNAPQEVGVLAYDGKAIYGTTSGGGQSTKVANRGTIFRLDLADGTMKVLYSFDDNGHGQNPKGGLIAMSTTTYIGTTYQGGIYPEGGGTIYQFDSASTSPPTVLHFFRNGTPNKFPRDVCVEDPLRRCYYSPQLRMNAAAGLPLSVPVQAADGHFYGVASNGGLGVIYRVDATGATASDGSQSGITAFCAGGAMPPRESEIGDTDLRKLCMFSGERGGLPVSLTASTTPQDGTVPRRLFELFGTTVGSTREAPNGVVFKATLDGRVTTLHNFTNAAADGARPFSVIVGSDDYLYGVTQSGGVFLPNGSGAGVIFRMKQDGSDFLVLHRLNGTTEGASPVAPLIETTSTVGTGQHRYLYGAAANGGATRGVIFRVSLDPAAFSKYEVVYTFPSAWYVSGSFPLSAMLGVNDPEFKFTLYGMTKGGGLANYGALFRLRDLDLPWIQQPQNLTLFASSTLNPTSKRVGDTLTIPVPGQGQPIGIVVRSDIDGYQVTSKGERIDSEQGKDGIRIDLGYCRNPHILQFISRDKFDEVTQQFVAGTFHIKDGQYAFSTSEVDRERTWHTDTATGPPNPYYEESFGSAHIVRPDSLTMLDAPNFVETSKADSVQPGAVWNYITESTQTWRAVFKDYVICNCKAVAEIHWTRQERFVLDANKTTGHRLPPEYVNVSITPPSDANFSWAKAQLAKDGYAGVP